MDAKQATNRFAVWLAETWDLDLGAPDDAMFVRAEANLFNSLLFAARDGLPWQDLLTTVRKMYTTLHIHAAKSGRTRADESLGYWVSDLLRAVAGSAYAGLLPGVDRRA